MTIENVPSSAFTIQLLPCEFMDAGIGSSCPVTLTRNKVR